MPATTPPYFDPEAERRRLTILKKESGETLAYHDLRRRGLAATDQLYQTLLDQLDQPARSPSDV